MLHLELSQEFDERPGFKKEAIVVSTIHVNVGQILDLRFRQETIRVVRDGGFGIEKYSALRRPLLLRREPFDINSGPRIERPCTRSIRNRSPPGEDCRCRVIGQFRPHGVGQPVEGVDPPASAGLDDGQHAFDEATAGGGLGAEGELPPDDGVA